MTSRESIGSSDGAHEGIGARQGSGWGARGCLRWAIATALDAQSSREFAVLANLVLDADYIEADSAPDSQYFSCWNNCPVRCVVSPAGPNNMQWEAATLDGGTENTFEACVSPDYPL
ncbi:MAG TPA: hypothetical protein VMB52_01240 [Verrucomicrobiae bacterium]|nr:hypothetical protein [Verrucomicrobiae bacterium]